MLSMKSVASALVLVASAADLAAPVLVVPAVALGVSTVARAQAPAQLIRPLLVQQQASQPTRLG